MQIMYTNAILVFHHKNVVTIDLVIVNEEIALFSIHTDCTNVHHSLSAYSETQEWSTLVVLQ